jgi:hypothetical protein
MQLGDQAFPAEIADADLSEKARLSSAAVPDQ